MTPFELDTLVNANWYKKAASTAGSVADIRRKQEAMGELYLDEEDNP
jgi:hypothetical protein